MTEKPHILLILTDHWRGDCLGRLGHPTAETPHLDSLAARGATFTRAYTPCPSCIAARRSLMTGMTPYSQGMVGYQDGEVWDYQHTLAGELTKAGYQTVNIGKTHFHPPRKHLGFEQLTISADYEEWLAQQPGIAVEKFAHGVPANSWLGRPNHLPEQFMEETYFVSRALDFLQKRDPTRPFFLTLSFNGPHPPWCPPQVYYDQFIHRELPLPAIGDWSHHHADKAQYPLDTSAWRGRLPPHIIQRARAAYFAYLAFLDAQVGRLLERMMRGGLLDDTLVVFTSDHGEMLGDHNLWRKTYAYEASARVPFIVKPPSSMQVERNVECSQLVGWEDIMPTFLEAAGAPIPATVEGQSALPFLKDNTREGRSYYHGEHSPCYHPENANQFLTDATWKYIWNPINGEEQLFNLSADPSECSDLAHTEIAVLEDWRAKMAMELAGRDEDLSDGSTLKTNNVPAWRFGQTNELHLG
jgi:arylsulfatase